jgi:hypothetical protein
LRSPSASRQGLVHEEFEHILLPLQGCGNKRVANFSAVLMNSGLLGLSLRISTMGKFGTAHVGKLGMQTIGFHEEEHPVLGILFRSAGDC